MVKLTCPECQSGNTVTLENGVVVISSYENDRVFGDAMKCLDCREVFILGLGRRSLKWYSKELKRLEE